MNEHSRSIDIRYHAIRQDYVDGMMRIGGVGSQDNTADILTKYLQPPLHQRHTQKLNIAGTPTLKNITVSVSLNVNHVAKISRGQERLRIPSYPRSNTPKDTQTHSHQPPRHPMNPRSTASTPVAHPNHSPPLRSTATLKAHTAQAHHAHHPRNPRHRTMDTNHYHPEFIYEHRDTQTYKPALVPSQQ
jgi:hypothetical protein